MRYYENQKKEMGRTGAFRLQFLCKESRRKRRKMDAGFQKGTAVVS
jgi:hypothetical protein